jgi:hypothetical protein
MTGHFAYQVATYLGSSTRKVYLARFHLTGFRQGLELLNREDDRLEPGPEDAWIEIDAHADGCVLQLFGALDAFSCAAAWHYRLSDANLFSLGRLAKDCPADLEAEVVEIFGSSEWERLRQLRHLASHRGVVTEKRSTDSKRRTVKTKDREEVLPILESLTPWGEQAVHNLQQGALTLAWDGYKDAHLL